MSKRIRHNIGDYSADLIRDLDIMFYNHEAMMSVALKESFDKEKTYELPDGNIITVGSERFRCPEVPNMLPSTLSLEAIDVGGGGVMAISVLIIR